MIFQLITWHGWKSRNGGAGAWWRARQTAHEEADSQLEEDERRARQTSIAQLERPIYYARVEVNLANKYDITDSAGGDGSSAPT